MNTQAETSVRNLYRALEISLTNPERTPAQLVLACSSQGRLAHYANSALGIHAMALNTLKKAANTFLEDGGWARLDTMRKSVLAGAPRSPEGKPRVNQPSPKEQLAVSLKSALAQQDQLHRARLRVERAYLELLRIARAAGARDPKLHAELERHLAVWNGQFGLAVVPGDKAGDT